MYDNGAESAIFTFPTYCVKISLLYCKLVPRCSVKLVCIAGYCLNFCFKLCCSVLCGGLCKGQNMFMFCILYKNYLRYQCVVFLIVWKSSQFVSYTSGVKLNVCYVHCMYINMYIF